MNPIKICEKYGNYKYRTQIAGILGNVYSLSNLDIRVLD